VAQFHNPEEEPDCDHEIRIAIDDNQKCSIQDYRNRLYEDIIKDGKKERKEKKEHRSSSDKSHKKKHGSSSKEGKHHKKKEGSEKKKKHHEGDGAS
jgi:mitogen-activated protein kinase 15